MGPPVGGLVVPTKGGDGEPVQRVSGRVAKVVVECGGVWWSVVVECGGVWWLSVVVECGG